MSTEINPNLSIPKLIKIEVGEFESLTTERKKNVKMEMKMENLSREREWLKKEVNLLEKTQSLTELEKRSVEEKLERSERRCEELDGKIVQMEEKFKKLRRKKMESEKAAQLYKCRVDELEPRLLKVEATLAKVLNVSVNVNVPDFAENGKGKVNAGDADGNGSTGIGLSKKGGRNLAYSGTEEDLGNALCGSEPVYISNVAESKGRLLDYEDGSPEVRGSSYRMKVEPRCNLRIIDIIKGNLQKENLELFGQSCFGNLLKINKLKHQGELILQFLLHLDMSASNKESLIFNINNFTMEFGPSDFLRITGLRFGQLGARVATTSSSIHKDIFKGSSTIIVKTIGDAFLNISSCHKEKSELTLKLALLYFLYGTLLNGSYNKKIDVQYLYLIEDLQNFNAFPWGRVAYDFLVSSILQIRLRMDGLEVTDTLSRFEIHGFCYALQAWAYEVMPCIATYCASRANNFENITPWILRWSVTKILKADDLQRFFQLGDKEHMNNSLGKLEELSTNSIPHASTPLARAKQKKRKLLCDSDQMSHPQPASTATLTAPPPSTNASTYSSESSYQLACRLFQAEGGMLETLLRKVDQPILDISYDDDLPRNEFPRVDDEEDVSVVTLTRHNTSGSNPVSVNKAADKHAKIERSFEETDQTIALSEPANDDPAIDSLWKTYNISKISEPEYERTKALYEKLLSRAKHLKLWIGYAKFEAFSMREILHESELPDNRKGLERARAVFERGLSYFESCGPELNEIRAMLLEEWFHMESSFGEVGDVNLVHSKLPRGHIKTEDGFCRYGEHIEYQTNLE